MSLELTDRASAVGNVSAHEVFNIYAMGTVFSLRVPGLLQPQETADIDAEVHRIDERFSPTNLDSWVWSLRTGKSNFWDARGEEREILQACQRFQIITHGYFNVGLGLNFDPGALVRGHALHRVAELLRTAGHHHALVSGGGDVQAFGQDVDDAPWSIGIAHPLDELHLAAVVTSLDDSPNLAVSTSGTMVSGHDIRTPSGTTATEVLSFTAVGADVREVCAMSTAGVAMGYHSKEFFAARKDVGVLAFMEDGSHWWNDTLLQWTGELDTSLWTPHN